MENLLKMIIELADLNYWNLKIIFYWIKLAIFVQTNQNRNWKTICNLLMTTIDIAAWWWWKWILIFDLTKRHFIILKYFPFLFFYILKSKWKMSMNYFVVVVHFHVVSALFFFQQIKRHFHFQNFIKRVVNFRECHFPDRIDNNIL